MLKVWTSYISQMQWISQTQFELMYLINSRLYTNPICLSWLYIYTIQSHQHVQFRLIIYFSFHHHNLLPAHLVEHFSKIFHMILNWLVPYDHVIYINFHTPSNLMRKNLIHQTLISSSRILQTERHYPIAIIWPLGTWRFDYIPNRYPENLEQATKVKSINI